MPYVEKLKMIKDEKGLTNAEILAYTVPKLIDCVKKRVFA